MSTDPPHVPVDPWPLLARAADWLHRDRFQSLLRPAWLATSSPDWTQGPWQMVRDVVARSDVSARARGSGEYGARLEGVPRCERHGVAHTGKLARSIILDLLVADMHARHARPVETDRHLRRAANRAQWVVSRLGTDPEHGGQIFLPGRFDPYNASTSLIDAGECVDALATFAEHASFAQQSVRDQTAVRDAIHSCAATYLTTNIGTKAITNQVLWGAMGLAHATHLFPNAHTWPVAVANAVGQALNAQRRDGSFGYEGARAGAHSGVADLTVYYHGRCLAFLHHIIDYLPEIDHDGRVLDAIARGTDFLRGVSGDDGRFTLALEGKRWFWTSPYEVGSLAYAIYGNVRGAERLDDASLRALADRSWAVLAAQIDVAGAVHAGSADTFDLICADFHTADLAWVARGLARTGALETSGPTGAIAARVTGPVVTAWDDAGVVRLACDRRFAVVRTAKWPANTQWGGPVGGGTVVATHDGPLSWEDHASHPGSFTFRRAWGRWSIRAWMAQVRSGLARLGRTDPIHREWRQWAFVWRMQAVAVRTHWSAGFVLDGVRLAWVPVRHACRTTLRALREAITDPVSVHWATRISDELTTAIARPGGAATWEATVVPSRRDGSQPEWASGLRVRRSIAVGPTATVVTDIVFRVGPVPPVDLSWTPPRGAVGIHLADWTQGPPQAGDGSLSSYAPTGLQVMRDTGEAPPAPALGTAPEEPDTRWRVWHGGTAVVTRVRRDRPRPHGSEPDVAADLGWVSSEPLFGATYLLEQ